MKTQAKNKKHVLLYVLLSVIVTIAVIIAASAFYIHRNFDLDVDMSMFGSEILDSTTRFYYLSSDGEAVELDESLRGSRKILYCAYEDIPRNLVNAFIAIEDKRFFKHCGVDLYRTAGAAANHFLGFEKRFGASTITQQLIKNVSGNDEVTVERKLQEIIWALDLERRFFQKTFQFIFHSCAASFPREIPDTTSQAPESGRSRRWRSGA